ncbi:hydroxymethylbilane synthase [Suttonella sp. R2A3]|uniref:hydroxymethylbilane synthase n=1 Tax=Suttonella sp. R2A3 TaxID=2908648 RepID=UPI001F023711|nr:hydroxymethylbilane synthase [Suttonella sp. R2A3]UJF25089.1 hydroxymethylbilane synthase [Suttonella sp. R2A3]
MSHTPIKHIRIATRKSKLALWQAEHVAAKLRANDPELEVSLVPIVTQGDKILDTPLARIGGKGLFIKELEIAMANDEADIAVHSMKDVGVTFPEGFTLAAILSRETPFDAFVSNDYAQFTDLPQGAKVGTCSLRRRMQIAAARPDLELLDLRGNVQTRLSKLDRGDFDAIVLASAGLIRLELENRIRHHFEPTLSLPAIGQGAVGIECRNEPRWIDYLSAFNDAETAHCVRTERIINERLQGSCQVPIAAYARLLDGQLLFDARIGMPDGREMIEYHTSGSMEDSEAMAHRAADYLIEQGALDILARLQEDAH